jgi:uncharacterized damage-inducible protein DinB
MKNETLAPQVISSNDLLAHWQGHRHLTRNVIEAFPEDKLFNHSVGGMRPFSELALEMLNMAVPSVAGAVSGEWKALGEVERKPTTKAEILKLWDESTEKLNELFPQIKTERFQEVDKAFGQYEGTIHALIFYCIDNEIHHRGQGYVYLRSLGIEPPFFWERGKVGIQDVG